MNSFYTLSMDNQLLEEYEVLRTGERLNMRYWDDKTLQTVCEPVTEFFELNLVEFSRLLTSTLEKSGSGVGLAANQVGMLKRMFAMRLVDTGNREIIVVYNPVLSNFQGRSLAQEGCLSIPTIYDQVERAESVHMAYQDIHGEKREANLTGMEARIAQHEVDHLDGKMFFDRMSKQMRKHVLRQWGKIRSKYE